MDRYLLSEPIIIFILSFTFQKSIIQLYFEYSSNITR